MKHSLFAILLILGSMGFVAQCSSSKPSWIDSKPEVRPNAQIQMRQVDMVKIGDSMVKASALLGSPTTKKSTPEGSESIWYLIPSDFQEDAYETLKKAPKETEGHKFIRLVADPKGKITSKEFEL